MSLFFDLCAVAAMLCALVPCSLFLGNLLLYKPPPRSEAGAAERVSVLIPARNEAAGIASAVQSILASTGVLLEVVVMDDASTDGTAAIVSALAARDPRVRLEHAPTLPPGWNGKQHACWMLAAAARYDILCFVDADVRLAPEAVSRMAAFLETSRAGLVSGFPRQQTETALEWLLLPLIHFVLLGLLPFAGMRRSTSPAYAAGCGQFLMVHRAAYFTAGGHAAIAETRHDGLRLPKLLRSSGYATDLADLTDLATCRMYHSASEVWLGLAKNATEGLAAPGRILPLSILLFTGQVLPFLLLLVLLLHRASASAPILCCVVVGIIAAALPRFLAAVRFRQRLRGALLHPVGIALLLCLEWWALLRQVRGRSVSWKTRTYATTDPPVSPDSALP